MSVDSRINKMISVILKLLICEKHAALSGLEIGSVFKTLVRCAFSPACWISWLFSVLGIVVQNACIASAHHKYHMSMGSFVLLLSEPFGKQLAMYKMKTHFPIFLIVRAHGLRMLAWVKPGFTDQLLFTAFLGYFKLICPDQQINLFNQTWNSCYWSRTRI